MLSWLVIHLHAVLHMSCAHCCSRVVAGTRTGGNYPHPPPATEADIAQCINLEYTAPANAAAKQLGFKLEYASTGSGHCTSRATHVIRICGSKTDCNDLSLLIYGSMQFKGSWNFSLERTQSLQEALATLADLGCMGNVVSVVQQVWQTPTISHEHPMQQAPACAAAVEASNACIEHASLPAETWLSPGTNCTWYPSSMLSCGCTYQLP